MWRERERERERSINGETLLERVRESGVVF